MARTMLIKKRDMAFIREKDVPPAISATAGPPLGRHSLTFLQDIGYLHAVRARGVIQDNLIQANFRLKAFRDHTRKQTADRAGTECTELGRPLTE